MENNSSNLAVSSENKQKQLFNDLYNQISGLHKSYQSILMFKNNEVVFKQGMLPVGLFMVIEGKLKISKYGAGNREQIVRLSTVGDITGHVSFFANETYSCTATSIGVTKICFLSKEGVLEALKNNQALYFSVMEFLSKEIRRAEEKIVIIAQKPVKQRVIEAILMLQKIYGFENDNATLAVTLSRTEIAGIAGTVRETVSRVLADLSDSGWIEIDNKKIKFVDADKLIDEIS